MHRRFHFIPSLLLAAVSLVPLAAGQPATGVLQGEVTFKQGGYPAHNATVFLVQLRRDAETNSEGRYEFRNVPPGRYDVVVHLHSLSDERQTVVVEAGRIAKLNFELRLAPFKEEITVTASGQQETTFESFQSVTSIESLELAEKSRTSLGEVLDNQPGIAKRSFGPGSARPVIRGFDGDRVLVLQDGIRTGTLSSASGDHGELMDASSLEKLEVVKGPATLLYGSNAMGGVINAVTRHHQLHEHPHAGMRGYFTGIGGSSNGHAGGSAGFEYGIQHWLLWGSGGGQRTGDYGTPIGTIENSKTRVSNGSGGFGWFGDKASASLGYDYNDSRYGVPFASQFGLHDDGSAGREAKHDLVDLQLRRQSLQFNGGLRTLQHIDAFRLKLNYTRYDHQELEGSSIGTTFDNRQFIYRGEFDQKKAGPLSGTFGFWGLHRDFESSGEEALTPPVTQNALALFALQRLTFEPIRFQFGGRIEYNGYDPVGLEARSFTGVSGAVGVHVPLWKGGALVSNYTHTYRAPALEELYNHGPHIGNLTFEIGTAALRRELGDGVDFSLRHSAKRVRGQVDIFYYGIRDFVYLAPTGAVEDGLPTAEYRQGNSRFSGMEAGLDFEVRPNFWLKLGMDSVKARLRADDTPLPRIPPLRGRVGLDFLWKGVSIRPGLLLAGAQEKLFPTESRTAGYTVVNLDASYTLAQQHLAHNFSVSAFNLGDRLYRNHLSFIKELAPEMGRGVRVTYAMRFF
ncbi:MAG: TonB-dependent receptor [Acidobacteriota bacterium]